ncbi:hypothetical protein EPTV-WA-143 [Eptesipox virus]|uniref:Uncharacterized protein n=1 Tax=Eptesipox virus TaxID=1329402 RepID=A0A220T6K2_9POXV|nr:hypothetical protein CG743_gp143 [Eptesipox virus]ASK51344.1 hypothetical protein EPTV-WA-143 [Eptesipox virus]WAH71102.1 hypothetical protein CG743_gp143 [Eptesipox virus]
MNNTTIYFENNNAVNLYTKTTYLANTGLVLFVIIMIILLALVIYNIVKMKKNNIHNNVEKPLSDNTTCCLYITR